MVQVAPVRLTYNPKVLWFDPQDIEFEKGDALIVKTERGLEYGHAESGLKEVSEESIENLKCELKPVIRRATDQDHLEWEKMKRASEEALPVFREMVIEQKLDMHPVAVEFLFDGDKAVFYFESDDRVDFRELVRLLAARFHVRIDMRQIGVRDEARIVGGLGHCGQELCCKRLGGEFNPVSIRMAKDQDLSLNPQKISGVCGRLMCCLRYEVDTYKECKSRCPKLNSMIETPEGDAKVVELNVPRETVTLLSNEDKRIKVPLADMVVNKKTGKPYKVTRDVYEECVNNSMASTPTAESLVTALFTGSDKLADDAPVREQSIDDNTKNNRGQKNEGESSRKPRRRTNRRRGSAQSQSGKDQVAADASVEESRESTHRSSRRDNNRSHEGTSTKSHTKQRRQGNNNQKQRSNNQEQRQQTSGDWHPKPRKNDSPKRPGQRSSGLSASSQTAQTKGSTPATHRKSRRRSHKATGGDSAE